MPLQEPPMRPLVAYSLMGFAMRSSSEVTWDCSSTACFAEASALRILACHLVQTHVTSSKELCLGKEYLCRGVSPVLSEEIFGSYNQRSTTEW